jgi:hypothetical protein
MLRPGWAESKPQVINSSDLILLAENVLELISLTVLSLIGKL